MSRYVEHEHQVAFFRLASTRRYLGIPLRSYLYAVKNAGTTGGRRAMLAGVRSKAEGLTAGVPDVECCIAVPPFTGLHIEFKKPRAAGGRDSDVTKEQGEMMELLTKCGRKCMVAFGCDEAWKGLCEYLKIRV